MKKWKKALVSVLTGCLMVGMLPVGAQASEPVETPYTYTFTLSAGDKGLINGQEKVRVPELELGDSVNLFENFYDQISLNAEDDKYYVKGFRLSGRDNQDMTTEGANDILSPVVTVTGDMDYVVAYGIKGDQVSYQVRYQDEDGNELAPTRIYYGNIGDKPIVAYHYIDGYIPQALALTKTLSADASENIFTFVYVQGDPSDIVNHVTETTTVDGTQVVTVVRPAQSAGGTGGGAGGGTGQTGTGGAEDTPETETIEEDQTPQGSQDIVDLDEEDTPLGDLELDEDKIEESSKGFPLALSIGIGAVAAVVLICLAIWLIKGRKAGKDGNTEE